MLQVKVQYLDIPNNANDSEVIRIQAINKSAKLIATSWTQTIKNKKCKFHPDFISTKTIVAYISGDIKHSDNYCCVSFQDECEKE